MRVLVTRPRADSEELVRTLEARGHAAAIEPLLHINVRTDRPADLAGVRTLLVTSANGVRAFAACSPVRDLRVLAVGEASAEAARAAGFARVESADGDAEALARLAIDRLDPAEGPLFHAAGSVTTGALKGILTAAGFDVRRVRLYEAIPSTRLSEATRGALAEGRIDAALFFSPRTARVFVRLVYDDDLAVACGGMEAVCLSRAVAEAVRDLPWHGVRVAEHPDRASLLAALGRDPSGPAAGQRPGAATTGAAMKEAMTQDNNTPKTDAPSDDGGGGASETEGGGDNAALTVIRRFGGIRPMAHKLGVAVSTVQGWKNRGAIPDSRHDEILQAARQHGIELDRGVLRASDEPGSAAPTPWAGTSAARTGASEPATADEHAAGAEAEAATAADAAQAAEAGRTRATAGALAGPSDTSSEDAAGTRAPARRGGGWLPGMLLGALILVVGVVAVLVTRDYWLPYVGERFKLDGPEQTTATTRADLESLQASVADLEARLADAQDAAGGGAALGDLRGRVDALEAELSEAAGRMNQVASRMENASGRMESAVQRIDALTARVENQAGRLEQMQQSAASADTVADLDARLGKLEEQVAGISELQRRIETQADVKDTARAAAAAVAAKTLAVAELRDALRFSAPFQEQLAAARGVVSSDGAITESLAALDPLAGRGVATRGELIDTFDMAARDAIAAAQGASEDGMLGGVIRRLNDIVTVRKVGGDAEGDDTSAVLARAEAKLAAGDLAGAVSGVDSLPDPAKAEMQNWLERAQGRLAAERALSRISADLMRQLAAAGEDSGSGAAAGSTAGGEASE